jgi:hypothetical protein
VVWDSVIEKFCSENALSVEAELTTLLFSGAELTSIMEVRLNLSAINGQDNELD